MELKIAEAPTRETNRMCYFGNPWITRAILERCAALTLTCDCSHWVWMRERLPEDGGEIILPEAQCCHHVHVRVG